MWLKDSSSLLQWGHFKSLYKSCCRRRILLTVGSSSRSSLSLCPFLFEDLKEVSVVLISSLKFLKVKIQSILFLYFLLWFRFSQVSRPLSLAKFVMNVLGLYSIVKFFQKMLYGRRRVCIVDVSSEKLLLLRALAKRNVLVQCILSISSVAKVNVCWCYCFYEFTYSCPHSSIILYFE